MDILSLMSKYSGISAIIIYLLILLIYVGIRKLTGKNVVNDVDEVQALPLNPDDEDALVACLIASIECRNEYHQNVRVVSVREVS